MPRQTITLTSPPAPRNCVAPTETVSDFTDFNQYLSNGEEFLVATNIDALAINVIIRHPQEPNVAAYTCSVPGGGSRVLPRFPAEWRQADGYIYVDNNGSSVAGAVEADLTFQLFSCDPSGGCAPCP